MRFSPLHFALVSFLLLAVALASAADADHNPTAQNPEDVVPVKIVNVATGRILAIDNDFIGGESQVIVADDSSYFARQWRLIPDGDFFRIVNPKSGNNLDARIGATPETLVTHSPNRLDPNTGHHLDNQLWSWDGTGKDRRLKSKSSNLVLDVDDQGRIVQRQANANTSQLWKAVNGKTEVSAVLTGGTGGPQQVTQPILHLVNGDFCVGELVDCDQLDIVRWNCPAASRPFDFNLSAVSAIYFPPHEKTPQATGQYCVELAGGDVLFGSVANLTTDELVLDSTGLGPLHIQRSKVCRLQRWNNATDFVYFGPQGTLGWQEIEINSPKTTIEQLRGNRNGPNQPAPIQQPVQQADDLHPPKKENLWRDEAGQLVTDRPDAAIYGDFGIPEQASIEFDISWVAKADFVLALCAGGKDAQALSRSFRFEVWDGRLIIVRESDDKADLADLMEIKPGAGHLHLQTYIDQKLGRILVIDETGRQLADLKVPDKGHARPAGGIQFINHQGVVRLEHLRISRWNGDVPADLPSDKSRIHLADGTIVYGQIERFDPANKQFVVRDGEKETRLDAEKVASAVLASAAEASACSLRVVTQDGTRISGKLEHVEQGGLKLSAPGIAEQIILPVAELKSVLLLNSAPFASPDHVRIGRLELAGVRLNGVLQNSEDTTGASALIWRPVTSQTASPLRSGISGQIIYRDPPPQPKVQQVQQVPRRRVGVVQGGVVNVIVGALIGSNPPQQVQTPVAGPTLYLRTGDTIPCTVTRIDQDGVTLHSPVIDTTFVSHDKIKALVLAPENRDGPLDKVTRQRLLTLPRMQKNDPPTQLIVSTNGDYLRGRLTEMDDKTASLEVHLETKQVPRDHIARIIWFHPDELDDPDAKAKPSAQPPTDSHTEQTDKSHNEQADKSHTEQAAESHTKPAAVEPPSPSPDSTTLVQALRSDRVRLTFSPQRVADSTLSGSSDVLGACRVELAKVDRILIGHAIDENAAHLSYSKWKLQNAVEPRFAQEDSDQNSGDHAAGTQGALVGQPAPDFELKLLDGGKFKLSDHKGHLVVLDFFATWCGPCVNAMPQVDQAVHDFLGEHVELLAVNMQEDPKTIQGLLERLNLKPNVALDQDGATAEKYSVTAIPQTVVIDAQGNVARLFIGGGPNFGDQLHDALQEVLHPTDPSKSNGL